MKYSNDGIHVLVVVRVEVTVTIDEWRVPSTLPNIIATIIAANIAPMIRRILFFVYQGLYKKM